MTDRYAGRGRRDEPPSEERAQSEVIGMVMLIGLVAIAAIALMLVAGQAVSDTEADAEKDRIEQSFVQLSHAMASATENGEMSQEIEFEAGDSGAVTKSDAGTINITGGDVNETLTMGAIEYEHEDGSIVAYQAGGVWAEQGQETRMVSAPPVTYDASDETLTLPLMTMGEEKDLSSGPVSVGLNSTDPVREASIVEDDTVTMEIQSPYYRGWERYFEASVGPGAIQEVDDSEERVVVKFGFHDIDGAADTGATIGSSDPDDFHDQHDNIGDDHTRGVLMPEMDPVIEDMIEDAENGSVDDDLSDGSFENPLPNGTYYVDEISGDTDYEFNLSDGDATLIVGDDVDLDDGSIRVTDRDSEEENVLRIYAGGDRLNLDGEICYDNPCSGDASVIQFYGPSTMGVGLGPGESGTFEGLLYVASSEDRDWWDDNQGNCGDDYQVRLQANGVEFKGSVVAYSVCAHSNGNEFDYDEENLEGIDIDPYPDDYTLPPQITYLNIAIYELNVENR